MRGKNARRKTTERKFPNIVVRSENLYFHTHSQGKHLKRLGKMVSLNNNISLFVNVYDATCKRYVDSFIFVFSPIYWHAADKIYQIFFLLPMHYFYRIAFLSSSHCFCMIFVSVCVCLDCNKREENVKTICGNGLSLFNFLDMLNISHIRRFTIIGAFSVYVCMW